MREQNAIPLVMTEEVARGNYREPGIEAEKAALKENAKHRDEDRAAGVPFTIPPTPSAACVAQWGKK